jgi:hypothetical protein
MKALHSSYGLQMTGKFLGKELHQNYQDFQISDYTNKENIPEKHGQRRVKT